MNIKKPTLKTLLAGIAVAAIVPVTVAASGAFQDKIIVKNGMNQVVAEYMVPSGTNHGEYAASQLGVPHNTVEWLSGDTEYNRPWGYEAVLLVRDAEAGEQPAEVERSGQDRIVVKNSMDQVVAVYLVPAGTNHNEYVAGQLGVPHTSVEWLSGDTEYGREWGYEAVLLVRDAAAADEQPMTDHTGKDRLIVKNTSNEVIAEYFVDAGVNHIEYVAKMQGVGHDRVEWLSGDTEYDREWGYEAHLLVR
jgi:hypothetical protein